MNASIWKIFGQVAGIAGLSLGVFLLLFRDVIRKKVFSKLDSNQSYLIIRLVLILTWSIAIIGIGSWIYVELNKNQDNTKSELKNTNESIQSYNKPITLVKFPSRILYSVKKAGQSNGKCQLSYTNSSASFPKIILSLEGFNGLGFNSNEKLWSYIFKDMSLSAIIAKEKETIYEARLKNTGLDETNQTFFFKQGQSQNIYSVDISNNYRIIDFLSSFLIISEIMANDFRVSLLKFNFFFNKNVYVADLEYVGKEEAYFDGKTVITDVLSLKLSSTKEEFFRYNVCNLENNVFFPIKIIIKDEKGYFQLKYEKMIL